MLGQHPQVNGRHVPHRRLALQCTEILRLGSPPFTQDQEGFLGLRVATLRRSGLSPVFELSRAIRIRQRPSPVPGAA